DRGRIERPGFRRQPLSAGERRVVLRGGAAGDGVGERGGRAFDRRRPAARLRQGRAGPVRGGGAAADGGVRGAGGGRSGRARVRPTSGGRPSGGAALTSP